MMNRRFLLVLGLAGLLGITLGKVLVVSAVSGAAFTTFNPWVDGDFKDICKNSQINCNIYGSKPDVWLNGGPDANGLGPDGEYFFAVLVPGGQPDPNDGGAKNLSDDFDCYQNRQFTVSDGEVSFYGGSPCGGDYPLQDPHDQDSGDTLDPSRESCDSPRGCSPDGEPPFIRLYPYADTWNPGGVYILAICSLEDGYPVEPRDCKYDAFKVKHGAVVTDFMLMGRKFKDFLPDGPGGIDPGVDGWEINISGTGFAGEDIDATVTTGEDGYWSYGQTYSFNRNDSVQAAQLTVCEVPQDFWFQTYPASEACYELTIEPEAMATVGDLDFGNWARYIERR
jgi:hypothetical protein